MALDTATVTLDIADLLGTDFRPDRTSIRATTNADVVVDTVGNQIRLGSGTATLNADGTATLEVWIPGTGSNPDSWQTSIHIDYPDRNAQGGRGKRTFGPFTITADANLADLIEEQEVPPTYLTTVTEALDGYVDSASAAATAAAASATSAAASAALAGSGASTDHGSKSGTLAVAGGSHEIDLTGDLAITVTGTADVTLFVHGTGAVTVAGEVFDLTGDPDPAVILVVSTPRSERIAFMAGVGGGEEIPPEVIDPPTQPGIVTVDPTADGYSLTWVASTVASGYEVQLDGGTWTDSGSDLAHAHTGLSAGSSHSGAVRAYNSEGERSTSRAWGPASVDSMTLHALLLSMNPEVYVRMTEGAIQDYSRVPATWSAYNEYGGPGILPTNFTGPALTPGDTGSLVPVANTRIERPGSGLIVGATALTQMTVSGMKPDATSGGAGTPLYYGDHWVMTAGQSGTAGYEAHQPGGVHAWFSTWNPSGFGDNNVRRYIDGATSSHSVVSGPGAAPIGTLAAPGKLFMGGNGYGGTTMGGYSGYTVVWKRALTESERIALATAAGTLGNPAGGTLT